MSWSELLPIIIVHFYALGTITIVSGVLSQTKWLTRIAFWLIFLGVITHTALLILLWETPFSTFTQPVYMFILSWLIIFIALIIWIYCKYETLLLPMVPLALLIFLFALLLRHTKMPLPPALPGITFAVHITAMFLSIGLTSLGFGASILFLLQEKSIKKKIPLIGFQKDIPALTILDKINALSVMIGFPLFSIGILFGIVSARLTWGNLFVFDPKEVISLIAWCLYAWLFYQRFTHGWQGRKPAILAIWIFCICVFSLVVVNFFTETYHNFYVEKMLRRYGTTYLSYRHEPSYSKY
ncbi:cytochrome c biogenesis protein [Lawsonia intracellularis]|uniref:ABC-type transport system involved in cytochrome c biogenesis, permease component n=1 Tax=Lawsonia intracellularis (strain PHE/MN1-00) TaxID=363253 RepID=Q1MRJ9_LAWIP|nr:cytochrome c biogenesis protein CcsA [Lawsonia intracellularis]AGC49733.1 cytochrome C assembly protein [Lawsonia intracellularis N343]KAA0205239.1 ABC transporter permease [Lawsonia intracellularis]MBZ3892231.1 cytochrome c biogenesis protein [Lawsonia intracellularis]OMQ04848.1 ABC transporter permease [Lawsonia intracellularis]RBN32214.1 ABC transporter permease [Lawsonia intracellularis]